MIQHQAERLTRRSQHFVQIDVAIRPGLGQDALMVDIAREVEGLPRRFADRTAALTRRGDDLSDDARLLPNALPQSTRRTGRRPARKASSTAWRP